MSEIGPATRALARFAAGASYEALPPRVAHQTKRVICDTIGCTFGGAQHEIGVLARRYARALGGLSECTIVGTGERTSAANAAYVNGSMANALDNDETFFNGSHPAAMAIWAALPLAERAGASGADVIAAVTVGYDVAARVCLATEPPGVLGFKRKVVSSGSWQTFGAAAAAGRILGLDEERMTNAFGIAGTYAPMPAQTNWNGQPDRYSLVKYFSTGWSAQVGVSAALLAQQGFTGPLHILDGETGFWRMQGFDECDFDYMLAELGETWWIEETSFKYWPACRAVHPYLTAFSALIEENQIKPEEIARIVARGHLPPTPPAGSPPSFAPRFAIPHPKEPINLQFNLPYALACLAHGLPPGPGFFAPDVRDDASMRRIREAVQVELDPSSVEGLQRQLTGPNPRRVRSVAVEVAVHARGQVFKRAVEYSRGDPWSDATRMSDDEIREKFVANASGLAVASDTWRRQIHEIVTDAFALERVKDTAAFVARLTV